MIDWSNIESCAQRRADDKTFNWWDSEEDTNPLGDLETREMAKMMAYRQALIASLAL